MIVWRQVASHLAVCGITLWLKVAHLWATSWSPQLLAISSQLQKKIIIAITRQASIFHSHRDVVILFFLLSHYKHIWNNYKSLLSFVLNNCYTFLRTGFISDIVYIVFLCPTVCLCQPVKITVSIHICPDLSLLFYFYDIRHFCEMLS